MFKGTVDFLLNYQTTHAKIMSPILSVIISIFLDYNICAYVHAMQTISYVNSGIFFAIFNREISASWPLEYTAKLWILSKWKLQRF